MLKRNFYMTLDLVLLFLFSLGTIQAHLQPEQIPENNPEIQLKENRDLRTEPDRAATNELDIHFASVPESSKELSDRVENGQSIDSEDSTDNAEGGKAELASNVEQPASAPTQPTAYVTEIGILDLELATDKNGLLQVLPKDVPTEEKRDQTEVTSDRKVTSPVQQERSGSVESHANGEQTEREREYANNSHEYYPSIPAVVDGSDRGSGVDAKLTDSTSSSGDKPGIKSQDADIETLKPDGEMPSFDEWKKTKMQEMHAEKIKHNEVPVQQQPHNGRKNSFHKTNYASSACGAKVLFTNPEAQSASFILTENRDQYMINPCRAKKWFIVELCEPVQIQSIELGNLELFSSTPEKFVVSVSERYPAKGWKMVGALNAKDERSVQNFPVHSDANYVKYVKLEIVSHYSREHYCPLSILRVFGTAVEDDDPDDDVLSAAALESDDDSLSLTAGGDLPIDGQSKTLLTAAKDTIRTLVKTVLSSSTDTHKATNGSADDKNHSSVAMDTKQAKRRLSWTVLTSCSKNSVWWYVRTHCNYCDTDSYTAGCWFSFPSVCGYVGVMHIVPPSCCVRIASNKSSVVDMPSVMPVKNGQRKNKRTTDLYVTSGGNVAYLNNATTMNRSIVGGFDVPTSDRNASDLPAADDESAGKPIDLPKVESSGGSKMSTVTDEVSSKLTHQKTEKLEHAPSGSEQKTVAAAVTEDSKLATDKQPAESQHKVTDDSGQLRDWSADEGSVDYELDDAAGVYQSCNSGGDEDGEQQPVQKLHSGKKETIYMKLRNRIKAMELNLSLSGRYLEELSQRYRRQMEEMYASWNKTITKLYNTSRAEEQRDEKQQEQLNALLLQLEDVTSTMAVVRANADTAYSRMMKHHMLLLCLEAVIFVVFVLWVLRNVNASYSALQQDVARLTVASPEVGSTASSCHSHSHSNQPPPSHRDRQTVAPVTESKVKKDYTIITPNLPVFLWESSVVQLSDTKSASTSVMETSKKKKKKNRHSLVTVANGASAGNVSATKNHKRSFSELPSPIRKAGSSDTAVGKLTLGRRGSNPMPDFTPLNTSSSGFTNSCCSDADSSFCDASHTSSSNSRHSSSDTSSLRDNSISTSANSPAAKWRLDCNGTKQRAVNGSHHSAENCRPAQSSHNGNGILHKGTEAKLLPTASTPIRAATDGSGRQRKMAHVEGDQLFTAPRSACNGHGLSNGSNGYGFHAGEDQRLGASSNVRRQLVIGNEVCNSRSIVTNAHQ